MDPALLNYLQSQQMNNLQAQPQPLPQGLPQGQPQQGMQSQGMQPQPGNTQSMPNPFNVGISNAIESARQSLGMTEKQQNKALRSSMLSFANNMSQQPQQRGFFNNFASVGRAMSPALSNYDQEEEAAIGQNNALANQILKYQQAEQERQATDEQRNWQRQHAEDQLAETRRSHNMMNDYRINKEAAESPGLRGNFIPITSKSERLVYTKDKKNSGDILKDLSSIKKDYEEFKELAANDIINPMAQYGLGKAANTTKDFFGYFSGNKGLREETSKRKALEAKLGKFAVELERKIKGGVLSEAMVRRFENKGLLPTLKDAPDVFEAKLDNLIEETAGRYKASDASLRLGAHISPEEFEELEKKARGETPPSELSNEENVLMQDANGDQYSIPANEVEGAMNEGFKLVGQ